MRMLSQAIAKAYCQASAPVPDRFFSVGLAMIDRPYAYIDAEDATVSLEQAKLLKKMRSHPYIPAKPIGDIENDLFSPAADYDGRQLNVYVPVRIEESLSASLVGNDWRFLGLIWWVSKKYADEKMNAIVCHAYDAGGRRVISEVKPEAIKAFETVIGFPESTFERPSGQCFSCGRSGECRSWATAQSEYVPIKPNPRESQEKKAARLFSERTLLAVRIKPLKDRQAALDEELAKLIVDGAIRFSPDEYLEIPVRTRVTYDFGVARRTLERYDLWQDTLAEIKPGEMVAFLATVPEEVRKKIEAACTTKQNRPSISEAARHATFKNDSASILGKYL